MLLSRFIIARISRDAGQKHLTDCEVLCNVLVMIKCSPLQHSGSVSHLCLPVPWIFADAAFSPVCEVLFVHEQ